MVVRKYTRLIINIRPCCKLSFIFGDEQKCFCNCPRVTGNYSPRISKYITKKREVDHQLYNGAGLFDIYKSNFRTQTIMVVLCNIQEIY